MRDISLGIQLYTLRRYLKKEENVPEVFRRVGEMGAECVQVSGMCDVPALTLDKIAKDNGLKICCTHSPFARIVGDLDKLAEEHIIYGAETIGIGMMPKQYRNDGFSLLDDFIEQINIASDKLKKYNLKLAYHNHAFELKKYKDSIVYDYMINNTVDSVQFIPDTYWFRFAGVSNIEYLKKLKNRVSVIHLKDYKKLMFNIPIMCEVGRGELDFNSILNTAETIGVKYAVIEQDISFNPYKSLEISMENGKKLLDK